MVEFLAKYWLEFLLGLIATGITFFIKSHIKWASQKKKEEQVNMIKEIVKEVKEELKEENKKIKKETEEADFCIEEEIGILTQQFDVLKRGILSIQKKDFTNMCLELLDQNHDLTLEEYRQCSEEHEVYNRLGGNHDGDRLFALVQKKAENLFSKDDK